MVLSKEVDTNLTSHFVDPLVDMQLYEHSMINSSRLL